MHHCCVSVFYGAVYGGHCAYSLSCFCDSTRIASHVLCRHRSRMAVAFTLYIVQWGFFGGTRRYAQRVNVSRLRKAETYKEHSFSSVHPGKHELTRGARSRSPRYRLSSVSILIMNTPYSFLIVMLRIWSQVPKARAKNLEIFVHKFVKVYLALASFALAIARICTPRSSRPKGQNFAPPPPRLPPSTTGNFPYLGQPSDSHSRITSIAVTFLERQKGGRRLSSRFYNKNIGFVF